MSVEKKRLKSLDALKTNDPGYMDMAYKKNQKQRFNKYLSTYLQGNSRELHEELVRRPDLLDSLDVKSLFILNALTYEIPLEEKNLFAISRNEFIANSLAKTVVELYEKIYKYVQLDGDLELRFKKIDLYTLAKLLPTVIVYYTDFILVNKVESSYEEACEILSNKNLFDNFTEDSLKPERLRLLALYYRRIGNLEKADEALLEYREYYLPDLTKKVKLKKMPNKHSFPAAEVVANLGTLYQEIKDIQSEVCNLTGVNEDTCFYYSCSECCHNDYPVLYYSEYKYLVEKLKEEGRDLEIYKAKAREIQARHVEKYGYELKLTNKHRPTKEDANPNDFKYSCPFLSEAGGCSVHSIRPMMCRAYGLSTSDNRNVQSCNYYLKQHQYNSNYENIRFVYDVRPYVALIEASDAYQTQKDFQENKNLCGTFIAWLCSDYS